MYDYDDEIGTVVRGGKKYRTGFGCHNKARAEEEVKRIKKNFGQDAIIIPVHSYWVCRPLAKQKDIIVGS